MPIVLLQGKVIVTMSILHLHLLSAHAIHYFVIISQFWLSDANHSMQPLSIQVKHQSAVVISPFSDQLSDTVSSAKSGMTSHKQKCLINNCIGCWVSKIYIIAIL